MEAYDPARLAQERFLLIVTSTYGDGDMPDNAQTFWDFLASDRAPALGHIQFQRAGPGRQQLSPLLCGGQGLRRPPGSLGARRLHPRVDCDVDVEAPFEQWFQGVLQALQTANATQPLRQAA